MKPTAYFINSARAGLVDYDALIDALENHRISGAALDVFYEEPLNPDSPFLKMDNVTLTPHFGGITYDALINSTKIVARHIGAMVDGTPDEGLVNPEVLEHPEMKKWLESAKAELGR